MVSRQGFSKDRLTRMALNRVANEAEIYRPDGSSTKNKYGKIEDKNYTPVGTTTAFRRYRLTDEEPIDATVDGGTRDNDDPRIIVPRHSDAREGDRLRFLYELQIDPIDDYVIPEGTTERYTDVNVDGTLTVNGELIIEDPEIYHLEDEFTERQMYREYRATIVDVQP